MLRSPQGHCPLEVVGYGFRSIDYIIAAILRVEASPAAQRSTILDEIDTAGVIATPSNSCNEMVMEAGRLSILNGGREAVIRGSEIALR